MFRSAVFDTNYVYVVGKMCSGKTTLANEIERYVYRFGRPVFRYALASPIKRLDAGSLIKDALYNLDIFEVDKFIEQAKEIEKAGDKRRYYQFVGNDVIRANNPTYFEEYAIRMFPPVSMYPYGLRPLVIVDDVRWPISLDILPNGISIKVEASLMAKVERGCDLDLAEHSSEQEVDNVVTDFYVLNNGEPKDLLDRITKVARR